MENNHPWGRIILSFYRYLWCMEEIIFIVKESEEGGFIASALGH